MSFMAVADATDLVFKLGVWSLNQQHFAYDFVFVCEIEKID